MPRLRRNKAALRPFRAVGSHLVRRVAESRPRMTLGPPEAISKVQLDALSIFRIFVPCAGAP